MAKYIIPNKECEALTFDEFVEFGKNQPDANIVDGMPWSFNYKGFPVTNENDERYIISLADGKQYDFTPLEMIVTREDNYTYLVDKEFFLAVHIKV
jgi:hypothetical protein